MSHQIKQPGDMPEQRSNDHCHTGPFPVRRSGLFLMLAVLMPLSGSQVRFVSDACRVDACRPE
jgi:hypothetical protein